MTIRRHLLSGFLLILSFFPEVTAQQQRLDSLRALVKEVPTDTSDVNLLVTLAHAEFKAGNNDQAISLAIQARNLARKIGYMKGVGEALLASTYAYKLKGAYEEAIKDAREAIPIFERLEDWVNLSRGYNYMAQAYENAGDRTQALANQLKAIPYLEKANYKQGLAVVNNGIGIIYYKSGSYDVALDYHFKALAISDSIGSKIHSATALNNIATIYERLGNYDAALKFYTRYMELMKEAEVKPSIGLAYANLGELYIRMNDLTLAEKYLKIALSIQEQIQDKRRIVFTLTYLGDLWYKKRDNQRALEYYQKAVSLAKELTTVGISTDALRGLSKVYRAENRIDLAATYMREATEVAQQQNDKLALEEIYYEWAQLDSTRGDFKDAFIWFKKHKALHDSLFDKRKNDKVAYLESLYGKERELHKDLVSQRVAVEEQQETASVTRSILAITSVVLLIGLVVMVFLYKRLARHVKQPVDHMGSVNNQLELQLEDK